MTPQEHQARHYQQALGVPCPVCIAPIGEPCMPVSCDRPHLDRCRQARTTYAWRLTKDFGRHLLDQRFATPAGAGEWRRQFFGPNDEAPLTLVAVVDGQVLSVVGWELAEAHAAWLEWEAT